MKRKTYNATRRFEKSVTNFGLELLNIELRDTGWCLIKVPAVAYKADINGVTIYTPVEKYETVGSGFCYHRGICRYEFLHGDDKTPFYAKLEAAPRIREINRDVPRKVEMLNLLMENYNIDAIALCFDTTANEVSGVVSDELRRMVRHAKSRGES